MSLKELSLRTKIPVPRLQQIEQGNFAALPPGIYARGMVRAVAREVGCDPERLVASLPQNVGGERATVIAGPAVTTRAATGTDSVTRVHAAEIDSMDVRRRRAQWCATVALVLLSGALYASFTDHSFRPSLVSQVMDEHVVGVSPAAPPADAAADAPVPGMTTGTAIASLATNEQADDLRIEIRADNVCWVSGTADGRRVIYRLLNAGDEAEIRAADLALRVGDPSALRLTINGGAARLLGRAGEPVTVHITHETYRDFLQPGTGPSVTGSATTLPR
jgi:cytoskeleton protein RodZ